MPFPVFHLGVAREVALRKTEYLENPQFFLGSIAPDEVLMNPGYTKEMKWASHLRDKNLSVWEENALAGAKKKELTAFQRGYIIHLLTDLFWDLKYYSILSALFDKDGVPKEERNEIYHTETRRVARQLYENTEWVKEAYALLERAQPEDFDGLVSAADVEEGKKSLLHKYYSNPGTAAEDTKTRYITSNMMQAFMRDAAEYIVSKLQQEE